MTQREQIIDRATLMFEQSGIKAIRMDDVAHNLGISKRTLYEIFTDKQDLLYQCMLNLHTREKENIQRACEGYEDSLEVIFIAMRVVSEYSPTKQRMMYNIQKFYPELYQKLVPEFQNEGYATLRQALPYFRDKGLVRPNINIDLSITLLGITLRGIATGQHNMELPKGVNIEFAIQYALVNFFRGIATTEGIKQIDEYIARQRENN